MWAKLLQIGFLLVFGTAHKKAPCGAFLILDPGFRWGAGRDFVQPSIGFVDRAFVDRQGGFVHRFR